MASGKAEGLVCLKELVEVGKRRLDEQSQKQDINAKNSAYLS